MTSRTRSPVSAPSGSGDLASVHFRNRSVASVPLHFLEKTLFSITDLAISLDQESFVIANLVQVDLINDVLPDVVRVYPCG